MLGQTTSVQFSCETLRERKREREKERERERVRERERERESDTQGESEDVLRKLKSLERPRN